MYLHDKNIQTIIHTGPTYSLISGNKLVYAGNLYNIINFPNYQATMTIG